MLTLEGRNADLLASLGDECAVASARIVDVGLDHRAVADHADRRGPADVAAVAVLRVDGAAGDPAVEPLAERPLIPAPGEAVGPGELRAVRILERGSDRAFDHRNAGRALGH